VDRRNDSVDWRICLCRARRAATSRRWPIRLLARCLSPDRCFLIRLDSSSRRPDGRNGRCSHHLWSLLLRTIRPFDFRTSCRVFGVANLARTNVPASEVMRYAFGERGAEVIAAGIAISTLGFLSQSILTAPRVYYAMARDGVFFKVVGHLDPRTLVPTVAIVL